MIGIDDYDVKCMYYEGKKGKEIIFHYKVVSNFNMRKQELVNNDMGFMPQVGITISQEGSEYEKYQQLDQQDYVDYVPTIDGEVKVCMKGLNTRQKLYNFGFEVWFDDDEAR